MMDILGFLEAANSWVGNHKELVTVIAVPSLTWFVTWKTARTAERKAALDREEERNLRRAMKVSEYRRDWIETLRAEFVRILDLELYDDQTPSEKIIEFDHSLNKILLLVNPTDEDFSPLVSEIRKFTGSIVDGEEPNTSELSMMMNNFLKKEWVKLKDEISTADFV